MKTIAGYTIGFRLGKGVNAKTHLVVKDGAAFCLKKVKMESDDEKKQLRMKNEIEALKLLINCDKIIQLEEVLLVESMNICSYYIITEVMRTDLHQYIKKKKGYLKEKIAKKIFRQVLEALQQCHRNMVSHHDIKAENVTINPSDLSIKLIDFGFATISNDEEEISSLKNLQGTPLYVCPEKYHHLEYDGRKSDIWSAGILLYKMVSGCFPFDGDKLEQLGYHVCFSELYIPTTFTEALATFLKKLLAKNPKKRMTVEKALQDEWFYLK